MLSPSHRIAIQHSLRRSWAIVDRSLIPTTTLELSFVEAEADTTPLPELLLGLAPPISGGEQDV